MNIYVSDRALQWFKEEVQVDKGDMIKFYTKIYGTSPVQQGYSLAFTRDNSPVDMAVKLEKDGIIFYVEETDIWFFNGHDLYVDYNEKYDEVTYDYKLPQ